MTMGYRQSTIQIPTARVLIIEFLCRPFGGKWLGEPGWMSVAQLTDGTGLSKATVRRVMRTKSFDTVKAEDGSKMHRLKVASAQPEPKR